MGTADEPKRGVVLPIAVTLVGLAAIGVAEDIPVRHSIEHTLTASSSAALRSAGVPFSNVRFVGRDGTVTVPSSAAGAQAYGVVKHVNGVRVVDVVVVGQPSNGGTTITASPTPQVSVTAEPSSSTSVGGSSGAVGGTPSPSASAGTGATPAPSATPTPSPSPSPGQATTSVQTQLNTLGEITFASGSTALTTRDKAIVAKVAAILTANPSVDIRLQGDTDSIGPAAFNLTVSRLRAHAVADALHALGVATNRMTVVGYGETQPKAPNTTAHNRAINRRVDIRAR
jgi:outer membrane protein OmpA-like peptidoglycan-associated protein